MTGLADVIADHPPMRWSNGTYACGGCVGRYEKRPDFDRDHWLTLHMPDWDYRQFAEHLAEAIVKATT